MADSPFELMWAIKNQPLPILENLRDGIPASLANLVRRMLRKDNPARVESVRQVGVELEKIQKELGTTGTARSEKAADWNASASGRSPNHPGADRG